MQWGAIPGPWLGLTVLPHDQHISTLILRGQEDLGHHDEDLALGRGVDVPGALHVGRVVPGEVGRLDVACVLPQLPPTALVCREKGEGRGIQSHTHSVSATPLPSIYENFKFFIIYHLRVRFLFLATAHTPSNTVHTSCNSFCER